MVDSAGSTGKKVEYQGKSYDYVFDVDIEDGKPPLKLPYNLSQNPYEAATKFLGDNELPISYLDNVANFITQNTQGASLGQSAQSSAPDPLGSDARYRPGENKESDKPKILPQSGYLSITAAKYDAMLNKITQINTNMVQSGRKDFALNPSQDQILKDLRVAVEKSKPIDEEGLDLVVRIVSNWPYSDRLAVLDLLRCMVPSPVVASYASETHSSILQVAITSATDTAGAGSPNENSVMMALRAVANIFVTAKGREVAAADAPAVASLLELVVGISGAGIGQSNRNVLIAATTALINYAVLTYNAKTSVGDAEVVRRLLAVLGRILETQSDAEVLYRALVALGTFTVYFKADATALGAAGWVGTAKAKSAETRVKDVADECLARLR